MVEGIEKDYLIKIYNNYKKLRLFTYNLMNFLSLKTNDYKENINNYKYNNQTENDNNKIIQKEEDINKQIENFSKIFYNELILMNKYLKSLDEYIESYNRNNYYSNNNNNQSIYIYYNSQKKKFIKSIQDKEINQRSEFISLIFKSMITLMKDSIIRDTIKTERKNHLFFSRNKMIKPTRPNNEMQQITSINDFIKDYIKNNFKNSNMEIIFNPINLPLKSSSKSKLFLLHLNKPQLYNILSISHNQICHINIKLPLFNIIITLPYNKEVTYNNYKSLVLIENGFQSHFGSDFKNDSSDLILFKKLKYLFQHRVSLILNLIYEEKRRKNLSTSNNNINNNFNNNINFDKEYLIEFLKRFAYYINDYDKMFKNKCEFCGKISKFSFIEKCFLPAYYKLYREKDISPYNLKNNNEIESNYFFHEECLKKMANPFI